MKINWLHLILPLRANKSLRFEIEIQQNAFVEIFKKIHFFSPSLTKTTVPTSILTSEVTDIAPQTQPELENMPGTQSETYKNLAQHMCKSHQTTSVNNKCFLE